MKNRETVVRQNRCDQELNFLLFVCFFFFFALQVLAGGQQGQMVRVAGLALYMAFVPGFFFLLGYCWRRLTRMNSREIRRKWLLGTAARCLVYFFVLTIAFGIFERLKNPGAAGIEHLLSPLLADVISFLYVPAPSAVFFTMTWTVLLVCLFDAGLCRVCSLWKRRIAVIVILLLTALLRTGGEAYPFVAALFGSGTQAAVPGVPYFAFFLLGTWFEEKKPGFRPRLLAGAAAVTAASLLLYRTPLQDLCRVTASFLPVYVLYMAAEGCSELTLRFEAARRICSRVEPVTAVAAVLVLVSDITGRCRDVSVWKALFIAAVCLVLSGVLSALARIACRGYCLAAGRLGQRTKHRTALYFLIYTAVFGILLFLVFFAFVRHGRTLLWKEDGISQYYPRAVFFANYIRGLASGFLHGDFTLPMYDFRLGLGGEVAYIMEPLYFLFPVFGAHRAEFVYTLLILLRFYLAGIASSIFFLYFKKDYFTTFLASAVYVFCGIALFGGARHSMMMIPMILFPLLILAVEEILRGRRWYLCTVLVALSLFSNYYYLYISTFGMGVYFIVRYFCGTGKKSAGGFIKKGLVISGSYLLGVAMACIILVSNFGLYVGSSRGWDALVKTPSLFYYSKEWLLRCFLTFLTTANSPGEWLKLGFLPIAFPAVVFLFARRGRRELKIFSVIAAACMAFPLAGLVLSGFSAVTNRWCYMAALLVAYIVADCLPDMYRMGRREAAICAVAAGVYGYLAFFGNYLTTQYTKLAFLGLCATLVVLMAVQDSVKRLSRCAKQLLLLALMFAMVFQNGYTLFEMDGVAEEYAAPGEAQERASDTPLTAVAGMGDDSFYRAATPKLNYDTISSSMMLDYNGTTVFYSTINGSIVEYLEKMGAASYSAIHVRGFDNRAFLNAPAAVKYYASYAEDEDALPYGYQEAMRTETNGKEAVVFQSPYALPLGYTYRSSITREELESYDVPERQEVMLQSVVLDGEGTQSGGRAEADAPEVTGEWLEIGSVQEKGARLEEKALIAEETTGASDGSKQPALTLRFEGKPDSETYLVLKGAVLRGDMSERPINLTFRAGDEKYRYKFCADDDRYGSHQQDYVFNLGYHREPLTSCTIFMDRAGQIDFDDFAIYSQPMERLADYTEALTEDVLEHVSIETNTISGDISLAGDKILVLSVPYQRGWTAWVDGVETKPERANYMYMALPLSAGHHTVKLQFEIPGVKVALVIMPAAVVLFIVVCLFTWLWRRRRKPLQSGETR